MRLVVALRKFWYHCGHATEALQFVRRALAGSESSDPERRAIGCVVGAELCFQLAELAAADEFAEQAHGAERFRRQARSTSSTLFSAPGSRLIEVITQTQCDSRT